MAAQQERTESVTHRTGRAFWIPAILLSTFAILVRLMVATRLEGIDVDGITYVQNAEALLKDWRTISVLHPPLYSLILAVCSGLWSDPEWGARVVSAVLGGLWVWPTLWLARETTDEDVSWTAGLLVAVMPAAVEATTRVTAEATYGLLLTAFLAMFVRTLRTGRVADACLAGALGGLAALARPEGMGYLVLAGGLLLLAPVLAGNLWTKRLVLTRLVFLTVVWLMILLPYTVIVKNQTGQWNWSGKLGWTLRWGESVLEERLDEFTRRMLTEVREDDLPQSLLGYIVADPGAITSRVAINMHLLDKYTIPALLHTGGIALILLGVLHIRFRRAPSSPEWFLIVSLLPLGGLLLFLVEERYFAPVIPVLSIIAGIGLARVRRREGPIPPWQLSTAGMILLTVCVLSFVPYIVRPWFRQYAPAVEKTAGLWLLRTAGSGATFIGDYPRIAYYAKARGVPFRKRSLDELLAEGTSRRARFLIVDNVYLPVARPDLLPLVSDGGRHPNLELVQAVEDRAGNRVVIYRLRRETPGS